MLIPIRHLFIWSCAVVREAQTAYAALVAWLNSAAAIAKQVLEQLCTYVCDKAARLQEKGICNAQGSRLHLYCSIDDVPLDHKSTLWSYSCDSVSCHPLGTRMLGVSCMQSLV